jgi:hypothetical protein
MPDEPRVARDLDPAALLRDLDGPRELPPELHQRLTDQLLSAAGDATQVLALRPELSSRLSDELQAQAAGPESEATEPAPAATGVIALDERRGRQTEGPGLLAELRSRWTIATSAAAAVVLLLAAVVGIVFHPGAAKDNHAAASGSALGSGAQGGVSSGAPLYPNSNGLSATTSPSSSSTAAQSTAAKAATSGANDSAGSGGTSSSASGGFAGEAAPAPSPSVSSVSPSQGPVTGGTEVTITGQGLGDATGVHFGSNSATSVVVVSSTEVQAVAPAHLPGTVDVVVVTPQGLSTTNSGDTYTYTAGAAP